MAKTKKVVKELELGAKIWEEYVPIIKNKDGAYDVYIQDTIEAPHAYNEMCHLLGTLKKEDKVNLHINTPGGYMDTAFRLVEVIDNCKAETTAVLTGTVASAGTMIALRCDTLRAPRSIQFMVHNYSGGTQGKGHEMLEHITFSADEIASAFNIYYKGFLSKKEMALVIAGKDMWMGAGELKDRWSKMKGKK